MKMPIDHLPSGRWRLRAQRRDGSFDTIDLFPTRALAVEARRFVRETVDEEALRAKHTLRAVGEAWLDQREAKGLAAIDSDRGRWANYILPERWVDWDISKVRRRDVKALRDRLAATSLASKTQREVIVLVRSVFADALEAELVTRNPVDGLRLPSARSAKALSYLYPEEERRLLTSKHCPLPYRIAYGFLAREGLRASEALNLRWRDIDLERGVVRLDRNKTKRPRAWTLGEDVVRVLTWWRQHRAAQPHHHVLVGEQGTRLVELRADDFRVYLEAAGVDRAELFEDSDTRRPLRIHDLRATFITLALAVGRTTTWVQDRTGHTTDAMLQKYRRPSRTATELELGWLAPFDLVLLGEGAPWGDPRCEYPALVPQDRGEPDGLITRRSLVQIQPAQPTRITSLSSDSEPAEDGPVDPSVDPWAAAVEELIAAVLDGEGSARDAALAVAHAARELEDQLRSLRERIERGDPASVALAIRLVELVGVKWAEGEDLGTEATS